MTSSQLEKRLTAVFAAESVTIGAVNSLRMEVWLGILSHYKSTLAGQIKHAGGKVIGRSQTAILAEFDTIVHAVDCGLKFQQPLGRIDPASTASFLNCNPTEYENRALESLRGGILLEGTAYTEQAFS